MSLISPPAVRVLTHPLAFALHLLAAFGKNQGLLLAGAIAYYALLSVVPLLILCVIALSHLVDQRELLAMLGRYLEWLVPSQSQAVLADVSTFLANRVAISLVLVATMLFFSAIAFRVLEKAMAIIFAHRGVSRRRPVSPMTTSCHRLKRAAMCRESSAITPARPVTDRPVFGIGSIPTVRSSWAGE